MIFTFYSFKGGVGRSMAMAGVAYLLAQRGLKVLTIDFDLEAPGLERYFFDSDRAREIRTHPGLMDLLQTYKLALTSETEFEQARFRSWWSYVTEAFPRVTGGGRVDLMTAGRREPDAALRDYALAVRTFDWQDFFFNWKGERFFSWLRTQLLEGERRYDVVLVDSRTGVTEMGGVSAYQLADVAVLLCAANHQNLDGTAAIASDFRSDAVLALRRGRSLQILVIPARLEKENARREEFLGTFEKRFGSEGLPAPIARAGLGYRDLVLPYDPALAIIERLVDERTEAEPSPSRRVNVFERLALALVLLADREGRLKGLQPQALAELTGAAPSAVPAQIADATRSSAGYDVFIDYEYGDLEAASRLEKGLEDAGLRVWIDTDLDPGTQSEWRGPGEPVAAEVVYRALDASAVLLVLFGARGHTPLRERLIGRVRERGRTRIVPVVRTTEQFRLLELYGLSNVQAAVLEPASDETIAGIVALVRRRERPVARVEPEGEAEPYPGDRPFREDEARFFFGREREAEALHAAVREHDVVLVTGAAGVGKTSLIQAGLLPRLRKDQGDARLAPWSIEIVDLAQTTAPSPAPPRLDGDTPHVRVLDGVDSFPVPGSYEARAERLALVLRAIAEASPTRKLVLVWRNVLDAADRRQVLDAMEGRSAATIAVNPLGDPEIAAVAERPAALLGHLLEPGLVDRLRGDARNVPAAVAQIQRVLPAIWRERRRGWLTNRGYDQAGLLTGALAQAFARVADGDERLRAAAEALVWNLLQLDASLRLVAIALPWRELASVAAIAEVDAVSLRDRLAQDHLVDVWRQTLGESPDEVLCALSQRVPAAYGPHFQQPADAEFMLWRARIGTAVQSWEAAGRGSDYLLSDAALAEAERHRDAHAAELRGAERALIQASVDARREREQRKLAHARAARMRLFGVIALLASAVVASSALIWVGNTKRKDAERRAEEAEVTARSNEAMAKAAQSEALTAKQETELLLARSSATLAAAQRKYDDAFSKAFARQVAQAGATTLYIQISNEAQRARAELLRKKLQEAKISVPGIEVVAPRGQQRTEIRYFHAEDADGAAKIERLLRTELPVDARLATGFENVKRNQFELWVGPSDLLPPPDVKCGRSTLIVVAPGLASLRVVGYSTESKTEMNLLVDSREVAHLHLRDVAPGGSIPYHSGQRFQVCSREPRSGGGCDFECIDDPTRRETRLITNRAWVVLGY